MTLVVEMMLTMSMPEPIFIGFRAKNVTAPSGFGVPEVCSMSDCVNDPTPGWIERWDYNRASCYNSEEEATAAIPEGKYSEYVIFAYRMYPVEFTKNDTHNVDLMVRLTLGNEISREPDISMFERIGYDVANGPTYDPDEYIHHEGFTPCSGMLGFGCSPLSCNGYAGEEFPVNQYYLLGDLDTARRAAEAFGREQPEPGTYFIYEILRKVRA